MDEFSQGLDLKWQGKYAEALCCFNEACLVLGGESDPDVLFNIGVCQWKLGNLAEAREALEATLSINSNDPDARGILQRINALAPAKPKVSAKPKAPDPTPPPSSDYLLPDFQKDAAILDANFLIKLWNSNPLRFPRFIKKARRRYNLYTSTPVYFEMTPIGRETDFSHWRTQILLAESLIRVNVPTPVLDTLENRVLTELPDGKNLKASHDDRPYAWRNDLSLVCMLVMVKNPIRYIVTNDTGVQSIVRFLHPHRDEYYHLRPNHIFVLSVNQFCETATKTVWERDLYGA